MFCICFIFSLCFLYVCLMFHKVKDEREEILRLSADDQASDGGQGVVERTSNKQEDETTKLNFSAVGWES